MKNTKKFAAMIAALTLTACSIAPMFSFADDVEDSGNTSGTPVVNEDEIGEEGGDETEQTPKAKAGQISFKNEIASTGHKYKAYRIFSGTAIIKENGKDELIGIQWANSSGAESFLDALKEDETIGSNFTDCTNAPEVAKVLETFDNDSTEAKAFAKFVAKNKSSVQAINSDASETITATLDGYYVIIEDSLSDNTEDSAMTSYLLAVYDADKGAMIGVKSAIPSVIKKIKENSTLATTVGNKDDRMESYTIPENYNDTADFSIGDTVDFQIIGSMPENIAEYNTYKYVFHDTLDSQFTLAGDFETNGVTVTVGGTELNGYTVSVDNNAITITFNDIKDACTTLNKDSKVVVDYSATLSNAAVIGQPGQKNEVYLEYSNNPNYKGEGDTDEKDTTSKTPKDTVIAFTYELDVTKIDGANRETKLKGAKFKLKATDGDHANKWVKVDTDGKVESWVDDEDEASELTSGLDGIFKVIGLDKGNYSLKETVAPVGYNPLTDAIEFEIQAEINNSQNDNTIDGEELTALNIRVDNKGAVDGDLSRGTVSMDVENNSGSTLPSTGGIGTTIFYLGGGAMVAVAGVFLITKKRMGKQEN